MSAQILVFCLLFIKCVHSDDYELPPIPNITATFEVFHPKGLRALIDADVDNFLFFDGQLFNGPVDAINNENQIRPVFGVAAKQGDKLWVFEDNNITLTAGQSLRYGFFINIIQVNDYSDNENTQASTTFSGVTTDYKVFNVTEVKNLTTPEKICLETVTEVRGRRVCAGEVIFEDNFDTLREDLWQIEHYIPTHHPEHPFVSYQQLEPNPNVFVENGILNIVPKLQEDLFTGNESLTSGTLNLGSRCTRRECAKEANGADIIPPIVSGRLISLPFSFKYGTIYVKAKLPSGDWLYPDILLEPLFSKYDEQSDLKRKLWVARAVGNRETSDNLGNQILTGGTLSNSVECRQTLKFWSDDFHEYSIQWKPDRVSLFINGEDVQHASVCSPPLTNSSDSSDVVNDFLHITLGVSAGGSQWFPDTESSSGSRIKPWHNLSPKAMAHFWRARAFWHLTWTEPSLLVDYVKVVALQD